jgi:hypothetical protein
LKSSNGGIKRIADMDDSAVAAAVGDDVQFVAAEFSLSILSSRYLSLRLCLGFL